MVWCSVKRSIAVTSPFYFYDVLYKVRPVVDITVKFKKVYNHDSDLAAAKTLIGFKGHFDFKQHMP
jgi:hypothetical protein